MKTVRSYDPPAPQCPSVEPAHSATRDTQPACHHQATRIGVGIDTSRYGHYAVFLRDDLQPAAPELKFMESAVGYQELQQRLEQIAARTPAQRSTAGSVHWHLRIDAAGPYAQNLEAFLRTLPGAKTISFGQSLRNKNYRVAIFGDKKKSDPVEAQAMARFALVERPEPAREVPLELRLLREIASRLDAQQRHCTRLTNQLHNMLARTFPELACVVAHVSAGWVLELLERYPTPERIATARAKSLQKVPYLNHELIPTLQHWARQSVASLTGAVAEQLVRELVGQLQQAEAAKKRLEKQLVDAYHALPSSNQLETITGFGAVTAAVLTARMVSIDRFDSADALIGYFGIFPIAEASGVDVDGNLRPALQTVMCPKGDDLVRRYLWMAALSAIQFNPAVRAVYLRRCATLKQGERGRALGQAMRKLLQLVYAVWKTGKPFDAAHYAWQCPVPAPQPEADSNAAGEETPRAQKPERPEQAAERAEPPSPCPSATRPEPTGRSVTERVPSQPVPAALDDTPVCDAPPPHSSAPSPAARSPSSHRAGAAGGGWVEFAQVRARVRLQAVLERLGHMERLKGWGRRRRGPCPVHDPQGRGRTFQVDLEHQRFCCFDPGCGIRGDVIDLWAAVHKQSLRDAALDLARTFGVAPASGNQRRGIG